MQAKTPALRRSHRAIAVTVSAAAAALVCVQHNLAADQTGKEHRTMPTNQKRPIGKLSHVMLGVADLDVSMAFYRDTLGLPVVFQTANIALLDAGGANIGLSEELAKVIATAPGPVELVFSVTDINTEHARLTESGVEFLKRPRQVTPTDWSANFRDPDGHILSLFGPNSDESAHYWCDTPCFSGYQSRAARNPQFRVRRCTSRRCRGWVGSWGTGGCRGRR